METIDPKYIQKLNAFYDNIVMDVVHVYFEIRILDKESFYLFLERHTHVLFHKYIATVPCCQCNGPLSIAAGDKRRDNLGHDQFIKLYDCYGSIQEGHEQKKNGVISQHCLCKTSPQRSAEINHMDIILISTVIKSCCRTYPGNPKWLKDIKSVRNYLSHLGDTDCISQDEFQDKWNTLESAVLELAGVTGRTLQKSIQRQIRSLRSQYNIIDNFTDAINTSSLKMHETLQEALQSIGIKIGELSFYIQMKTGIDPFRSSEAIDDVRHMPMQPELTREADRCYVLWKFQTPGSWDVKTMAKKLEDFSSLLDFKVHFVYSGSLIIQTSISKAHLNDSRGFAEAVKSFVHKLVEICELDTSTKTEVIIDMEMSNENFVTDEEVKYVISPIPEKKQTCTVCERKDKEISRLRTSLDHQLEREYTKLELELSQIDFTEVLGRDVYIGKNVEDTLMSWNDETEVSAQANVSPERKSSLVCKNTESMTGSIVNADKKDKQTAYSEDVETEIRLRVSKKEEIKFSKHHSFDLLYDDNIAVTCLSVTTDNKIIICNVCTNKLLMYDENGQFQDFVLLLGNPWCMSLCPRSGNYQLSTGVVTIPESMSYQYVRLDQTGFTSDQCVYLDFQCYGVKVTDENIMIGKVNAICILNRQDEILLFVSTEGVVLYIDLSFERNNYLGIVRDLIVFLDSKNIISCIQFVPEWKIMPAKKKLNIKEYQDIPTMFSLRQIENSVTQRISCMAVGRHNHIYVSSNSKNEICKWDSSTSFTRVLDKTDGIETPSAICFNENYDKLYTSTENGRSLIIWQNNEYGEPTES